MIKSPSDELDAATGCANGFILSGAIWMILIILIQVVRWLLSMWMA